MTFLKKSKRNISKALKAHNLRELIEDICTQVKHTVHSQDLDILLRYNEITPEDLLMDVDSVTQTLTLLIENAVKATQTGFILICVSAKPILKNVYKFKIDILNTSVEITSERIESIFGRENSKKYSENVLNKVALGKAPRVHWSMQADNCKIDVTIPTGKFTVTTFESDFRIVSHGKPSKDQLTEIADKKVLVIDTLAANRHILCEQISEWGLQCQSTGNFRAAFQRLVDAHKLGDNFDLLIFMNCKADSEDGRLLSILRKTSALKSIPAIMLTRDSHDPKDVDMTRLELSSILYKPVKRPDLLGAICAALKTAKSSDNFDTTRISNTEFKCIEQDHKARTLKILIAEDNEMNQYVFKALLSKSDVDLIFAQNGHDAVEKISHQEFDVIFMDLSMPVMGGLEATERIREFEIKNDKVRTPIICLSAHAGPNDRKQALQAGMDDYLVKPIIITPLIDMVNKWGSQLNAADTQTKAA